MKTAKITYSDGNIITTSINGTDEEIKNYFKIGRPFNLGNGDKDNMQTVVSCEILIKEVKKDLIANDISRCNDYRCPTRGFCARFRQLRFDNETGIKHMSVTDFKGREKNGLCDHFINVEEID